MFFRDGTFSLPGMGFLTVVAVAVLMGEIAEAQSLHSVPELDARSAFSELVTLVGRHGWIVDLGRMCKAMPLDGTDQDCHFRQIAFNSSGGELDRHGFNLPVDSRDQSYVLIFHLRPLIGEFFVVSTGGNLIATFFRAKGVDYSRVSNADGIAAFEKELAYWRANLAQIERDLSKPRPGPIPGRSQ